MNIKNLNEELKKFISEELNDNHPLMKLIEYVKQNGTDKGSEISVQFGDNTLNFDKQKLEDDRQTCKALYNGLEIKISLSAGSDCIWMEPYSYYMRPWVKAEEKDDIKTIIEKIFQCAQYVEDREKEKERQRKINADTKEIFNDLADKFECILNYWKDYELVYEGRDEDGCPDYSREYLGHDYQYLDKLNEYNVWLEEDLVIVLQGSSSEQNEYEYPSGGTPDNITYTSGITEADGICVFGDDYNKELNMKASEYIIKNYPDSKLAEYIKDEGIDEMDIDDFRDELIDSLDCMDLD